MLEMAPGAAVPATADDEATAAAAKVPAVPGSKAAARKPGAKPVPKPAVEHPQRLSGVHGKTGE